MLTAYEVGPGITQKPLHKERVQILWRVPTGKDDGAAAEAHSFDLDADRLNSYLSTITEILPESFSMESLERDYAPMNHAGNSKVADGDDGLHHSQHESRTAEEASLYDGGPCSYDPYSLYGFNKFGHKDHIESFDESAWGIDPNEELVEVDHAVEGETHEEGHGAHELDDEHHEHEHGHEYMDTEDIHEIHGQEGEPPSEMDLKMDDDLGDGEHVHSGAHEVEHHEDHDHDHTQHEGGEDLFTDYEQQFEEASNIDQ